MKAFRHTLLGFCLLFLPLISGAQSSAGASDSDPGQKIFNALPFEHMINEAPQDLHSQFSQNPFGLSASKNSKMMKLFLKAYDSQKMMSDAQEYFLKNYSSDEGSSVISWLDDKKSKAILRAQNKFYSLQGIRKRIVTKYELEQNPPSEKRARLIDSLATVSCIADSGAESQTIIFRALISAFDELSQQRSLSKTQVDGIVSNFRNQARSQMGSEQTNRMMVMYHNLDNKTLRHYLDFQQSTPGKWLCNITSDAIHSAYNKAADRFLKAIRNSEK